MFASGKIACLVTISIAAGSVTISKQYAAVICLVLYWDDMLYKISELLHLVQGGLHHQNMNKRATFSVFMSPKNCHKTSKYN